MPESSESRDLLIRIETKLERCIQDISELRDHTSKRVDALEHDKFDKIEADKLLKESEKIHDNHDMRLRAVEKQQIYWKGGLGVLGVLFSVLVVYVFEKL